MARRLVRSLVNWSAVAALMDEFPEGDDWETATVTAVEMKKLFKALDQDGDGKASFEELVAHSDRALLQVVHRDAELIMEELDHDKDGRFSLAEVLHDLEMSTSAQDESIRQSMEEGETAKFKAADLDGDGFLNKNEVISMFFPETSAPVIQVIAEQGMRNRDENDDGRLSMSEFFGVGDEASSITDAEKEDFKKLDLDGDQFISIAELGAWEGGRFHLEEAMRKLVHLADTDGDKHFTEEEFLQARRAIGDSDAHYHLLEWSNLERSRKDEL